MANKLRILWDQFQSWSTRQKAILISGIVLVLVLIIVVPVVVVTTNDSESTKHPTTSTESNMEAIIVKDLLNLNDSLQLFMTDISDKRALAPLTTTTQAPDSAFKKVYDQADECLKAIHQIAKDIQAHPDHVDFETDKELLEKRTKITSLDLILQNISINTPGDEALANDLIDQITTEMNVIADAINSLEGVTTVTEPDTTHTTPVTDQHLAVEQFNRINDTIDDVMETLEAAIGRLLMMDDPTTTTTTQTSSTTSGSTTDTTSTSTTSSTSTSTITSTTTTTTTTSSTTTSPTTSTSTTTTTSTSTTTTTTTTSTTTTTTAPSFQNFFNKFSEALDETVDEAEIIIGNEGVVDEGNVERLEILANHTSALQGELGGINITEDSDKALAKNLITVIARVEKNITSVIQVIMEHPMSTISTISTSTEQMTTTPTTSTITTSSTSTSTATTTMISTISTESTKAKNKSESMITL